MSNKVIVKLPENAVASDIGDIFAFHEYGDEFVRALDLQPRSADDALEFDEWLPLSVELSSDIVTIRYRVMFIGKGTWDSVDRHVEGIRQHDMLVFDAFGKDT